MNPPPISAGDRIHMTGLPECWALVVEVRGFQLLIRIETDFGDLQFTSPDYFWDKAAATTSEFKQEGTEGTEISETEASPSLPSVSSCSKSVSVSPSLPSVPSCSKSVSVSPS